MPAYNIDCNTSSIELMVFTPLCLAAKSGLEAAYGMGQAEKQWCGLCVSSRQMGQCGIAARMTPHSRCVV